MGRIVVTGLGCINPLGFDLNSTWKNLLDSKSSLSHCENTTFEYSPNNPVKIISEIKNLASLPPEAREKYSSTTIPLGIDLSEHLPVKDLKRSDIFISYGLLAADEALKHANWLPTDEESLLRTAVVVGSGIGGMNRIEDQFRKSFQDKARVSPFFIPSILINLLSGQISMKYGFMGPNSAVVTACSTGAHSIHYAAELIRSGVADVAVCGGSESVTSCEIAISGFAACRALSTKKDDPTSASRPWDKDRDGFVISEGSGILILESLEHAQKRDAKIYAEYRGAGLTGDAYHITTPHPEGLGARKAVEYALKSANASLDDVDYINAHGTSTPIGDLTELRAMQRVFEGRTRADKLLMSSTKSSVGHLLGAAGGLEAIFSIKSIMHDIVPPTLNLDNPEDDLGIFDLVPHKPKEAKVNYALSNSFGFGGTNISLLFSKFKD